MTQTIKQRSTFEPKVVIGAKYDGPPLDRPCLRQLPAGWELADETPHSGDHYVIMATIIAGGFLLVTQIIMWWLA